MQPVFTAKWVTALLAMVLGTGFAFSQDYPVKPIRIVTSEAGGGNDFSARLVAQGLTDILGQHTVVENRAGGSGIIAAQTVARATPDGYTLFVQSATLWLLPFLRDNVPYDPLRDFSPITLLQMSPNVVVVYPAVPASSVKDLIALAKSKPGELSYGTSNPGGTSHLAAELFRTMTGLEMLRVPYKGTTSALNDMLGGRLQLMFPAAGSVAPHIKSGRLKALAVTSAQPSTLLPGLPTVAATVPGYESVSLVGMFAPGKTPAKIVTRVNQEIAVFLKRPEVREKFLSNSLETVGNSPAQFGTMIRAEMTRMGKVIKDAGIREE